MKGIEGNPSEIIKPPQIAIIEKGNKNLEERVFNSIYDNDIHDPDSKKTDPRIINEDFERASKRIVGNRELELLIIIALHAKDPGVVYATMMNELTKACISLSDTNIDNLLNRFKKVFSVHFEDYSRQFNLNDTEIEKMHNSISTGSLARGIKPVVHFVRGRKNIREKTSNIISAFYFENHLDAYHGIDLIEILEREDGIIINLVQIKAHEYTGEEIERYTKAHEKWARDYAVDMESYESNFSQEPDFEGIKSFKEKVASIKEIFVEILTSGNISPHVLYDTLGIGKFKKSEQIWILQNYLPVVKENFEQMIFNGILYRDEEDTQLLLALIEDLESELNKIADHNKDIEGIAEIHSICATDIFDKKNGYERSDTIVFKNTGVKRKAVRVVH